jgi:hypothetical protein
MKIVNTDQAKQWNTGDDAAHWVNHQDRYDRMNAPFADMILDEAVEFLRTSSIGRTVLTGVDPGLAARALASLRAALAPHADEEGVHLTAAVWLVQATAS